MIWYGEFGTACLGQPGDLVWFSLASRLDFVLLTRNCTILAASCWLPPCLLPAGSCQCPGCLLRLSASCRVLLASSCFFLLFLAFCFFFLWWFFHAFRLDPTRCWDSILNAGFTVGLARLCHASDNEQPMILLDGVTCVHSVLLTGWILYGTLLKSLAFQQGKIYDRPWFWIFMKPRPFEALANEFAQHSIQPQESATNIPVPGKLLHSKPKKWLAHSMWHKGVTQMVHAVEALHHKQFPCHIVRIHWQAHDFSHHRVHWPAWFWIFFARPLRRRPFAS